MVYGDSTLHNTVESVVASRTAVRTAYVPRTYGFRGLRVIIKRLRVHRYENFSLHLSMVLYPLVVDRASIHE